MVIRKFLKKYGWYYIPGVFFLLLNVWIQNQGPRVLGLAIDSLKEAHPVKALVLHYALLIVLIAVGVFVTRFLWRMFIIGNGRRMECFLREELFIKLQNMPPEFYARQRSGDLMAYAINDVNAVRLTFGPVLAQTVNGIATAILSIRSMTAQVSGSLTMMVMIPVSVAVIAIFLIGNEVQKRFTRVQSLFSRLSGFVNEAIMGSRVIKAFAREKEWDSQFSEVSSDMKDANVSLVDASVWLGPITAITFGLSYAVSLSFGGHLVAKGSLQLGDLVAFLGYLTLIQNPVTGLGRIVNRLYRGIASYKRLNEIFSQPSIPEAEKRDYEGEVTGAIEARHLTFTYPGSTQPVLKDVSFNIPAGSTLGIAGRTGCGKTTLVELLLKFYTPPKGQLFLDGKDICEIPARAVREESGYVPQDSFLFSTPIREDIRFYEKDVDMDDIREAAEEACIDEDIMAFPNGYDTQVGERGTRLSGGQKQRIALARALVRNPKMLILDDTLSAVDNITEKKIVEQLDGVLKDKTSIIISHRLSALRSADLILYMDDGRVVESGTHEQLMARKGEYYRVYEKQSREAQHEQDQ